MPITVEEKAESRTQTTGDNPSVELVYIVRGADDDLAVRAALEAFAPATYDGLPRQSVGIEPAGPQLWDGSARYAPLDDSSSIQPGESVFTFDTGGGTQRITQSLATVGIFAPAGQTAPNFKGAIGVTDSGVEGVDIAVPVYNFTETHVLADSVVTPTYKTLLSIMTGKVNSDAFRNFSPGEVLFLGATGSQRGAPGAGGDWEITFRFAASFNATGLTAGDITGIAKKGWEYLWVRYEDVEDAAAQTIVKQPVAAYVERVYLELPFTVLGI